MATACCRSKGHARGREHEGKVVSAKALSLALLLPPPRARSEALRARSPVLLTSSLSLSSRVRAATGSKHIYLYIYIREGERERVRERGDGLCCRGGGGRLGEYQSHAALSSVANQIADIIVRLPHSLSLSLSPATTSSTGPARQR